MELSERDKSRKNMTLIKKLETKNGNERVIFISHLGRKCSVCKKVILPRQEFVRESLAGKLDNTDPVSYSDKHLNCE